MRLKASWHARRNVWLLGSQKEPDMKAMIRTFKQICALSLALFAGSSLALAADGDEPQPGPTEPELPSGDPALPATIVATGDGEYWLHKGSVSARALIQGTNITINTFLDEPNVPTPHAVRADIKCWIWQEDNFTTGGSFDSDAVVEYDCPPDHPVARAEILLLAN